MGNEQQGGAGGGAAPAGGPPAKGGAPPAKGGAPAGPPAEAGPPVKKQNPYVTLTPKDVFSLQSSWKAVRRAAEETGVAMFKMYAKFFSG